MASRELLSAHKTVAKFDGLTERKCFHRTTLCPDQCDHGGTIATLSIQKVVEKIKQNMDWTHIPRLVSLTAPKASKWMYPPPLGVRPVTNDTCRHAHRMRLGMQLFDM